MLFSIIKCVIQHYSVVFSIIQYCVFSDIKELDNEVFSDRQLAYKIAVGTTIILEALKNHDVRLTKTA